MATNKLQLTRRREKESVKVDLKDFEVGVLLRSARGCTKFIAVPCSALNPPKGVYKCAWCQFVKQKAAKEAQLCRTGNDQLGTLTKNKKNILRSVEATTRNRPCEAIIVQYCG